MAFTICASGRAAWMWIISVPSRASACLMRGRSGSMSAGWRWRRISRPSWRWICPAPRWWWATARPGRAVPEKYPEVQIPGRAVGRGAGQGLCRQRRLRLSQPHRHLRPGACWRHWPAACPVAAYPVQGPLDVVGGAAPVWRRWMRICATACLRALEIARNASTAPYPPGALPGPFLAGLHPPVPAQYRGRAGPGHKALT